MAAEYGIENLLRPPVEFYSAATALLGAGAIVGSPSIFMIAPTTSYLLAAGLTYLSVQRARQGYEPWRYQKQIRRMRDFNMYSRDIPVSNKTTWLGMGFEWKAIHTQRLTDLKLAKNAHYLEMGSTYNAARKLEDHFEHNETITKILKPLSSQSRFNPARPMPPTGGDKAIHAVSPEEYDIKQPLDNRSGHTLIAGTTRAGKSKMFEVLITQAIQRKVYTQPGKPKDFEGPVVCLDPKGDASLMTRMYIEAKRAGRKFYIFHLGFPSISCRYNAVAGSFARFTEVASRSTDQLSSSGSGAAFKDFAWRFVNIIANAEIAMGVRPTFESIQEHIMNIEPLFCKYAESYLDGTEDPSWLDEVEDLEKAVGRKLPRNFEGRTIRTYVLHVYLTEKKVFDPVVRGLMSAVAYEKGYFDKITASFLPLLEKLTTGEINDLLSPDYDDPNDKRPILDWMKVARQNAVVYCGFDAMSDQVVSDTVGGNMISDLVSTSGYIYKNGMADGFGALSEEDKKPTFQLFIDEGAELASERIIPMLNKAGGAGISLTMAMQGRADMPMKTGSTDMANVIYSNFNTLIMLRVKTRETAELLTDQLGEVYIHSLMRMSGANDSSDVDNKIHFTSGSQDRQSSEKVPLITPDNIINQPKGQAFALVDGATLYHIRNPLLKDEPHELPPSLAKLRRLMADRYKTGEGWWKSSEFTQDTLVDDGIPNSENGDSDSSIVSHNPDENMDRDGEYESLMEHITNGE